MTRVVLAICFSILAVGPAHGQLLFNSTGSNRNNNNDSSTGSVLQPAGPGTRIYGGGAFGAAPVNGSSVQAPNMVPFGNALIPNYYGNAGLGPAPGVSPSTGVGVSRGQFLYNNPAYYMPGLLASPPSAGLGSYRPAMAAGMNYWLAPSGYYYSFADPEVQMIVGTVYPVNQVIYVFDQGAMSPAQPPVTAVISDLRKFLLDANDKHQIERSNYESAFAKLNDIADKADQRARANNGALDTAEDAVVRRELDELMTEISRALLP